MRDDDIRSSCFASLDVLCATHGVEVPYSGGLDAGFPFRGRRVPFLSYMKGIHRAAAQRGPAALSIVTAWQSPYGDRETGEGVLYAYREGSIDQPDNRALRAAVSLAVPIAYYVGTRPGWYRPLYPCFAIRDDPVGRQVLVTQGAMVGPVDERAPVLQDDPIERRYAVREMRVRVHQARFRGRVLPAYRSQCTVCRLRETRLLDAAHILADAESGEPEVSNGLSLCSIHHRAFDQDLVGISPDYAVRVSPRLLDDDDSPMLELLKGAHGVTIEVPQRKAWRPDPGVARAPVRSLPRRMTMLRQCLGAIFRPARLPACSGSASTRSAAGTGRGASGRCATRRTVASWRLPKSTGFALRPARRPG